MLTSTHSPNQSTNHTSRQLSTFRNPPKVIMGERRERSPAKRERSPAIKRDRSPIKRGERERSPLKKGDLKSPIKRGERSPGKRDRSPEDLKKEGRERSVGQVWITTQFLVKKLKHKYKYKHNTNTLPGKSKLSMTSCWFQVARDVGSKVEKAEKPEVPKFVVDRWGVVVKEIFLHGCKVLPISPIDFSQGEDMPFAPEGVLQPAPPQQHVGVYER